MKVSPEMLRVYAVTDRRWLHGNSLESVVEALIQGGVTMVQLREKELDEKDFLEEAMRLKLLCDAYSVPLIINDNVEIARTCQCGLHIGQSDAALLEAREILGDNAIIGVSCTTVEQAMQAEKCHADYLGVGAMFPTGTKHDAQLVTLDELSSICGSVHIPVVAIGGITLDNVSDLLPCGIAGVAIVSALFAAPSPKEAARHFTNLFQKGKSS